MQVLYAHTDMSVLLWSSVGNAVHCGNQLHGYFVIMRIFNFWSFTTWEETPYPHLHSMRDSTMSALSRSYCDLTKAAMITHCFVCWTWFLWTPTGSRTTVTILTHHCTTIEMLYLSVLIAHKLRHTSKGLGRISNKLWPYWQVELYVAPHYGWLAVHWPLRSIWLT